MKDICGREITHLRVSITQRCNLNCFYCHHEGEQKTSSEMKKETILSAVHCMAEIGVKYVKITGGEPLLRADIVEIVRSIAQTKGISDISLTTNGFLLGMLARSLKDAGLTRINIGCDSFSSNITPKRIKSILPGLETAKSCGFSPIKLNMVLLKGINDHEIDSMIEFAKKYNVVLQLIELVPNGSNFFKDYYLPLKPIEEKLASVATKIVKRKLQSRMQYMLNGVIVEIIRPTHEFFCRDCNKIRLTSDGLIKPCLMRNDNLVEFTGMASIRTALQKRSLYHHG